MTLRYTALFSVVAILFVGSVAAQEVDLSITIDDGIDSQVLQFGLDPAATDGLDGTLSESELPPFPPSGAFDARFVDTDITRTGLGQGSLKDFVTGGASCNCTKEYEIRYQVGDGTQINISWNLPGGVEGTLVDFFGGVVVDETMVDSGGTSVTNLAVDKLKMTINYGSLPVELATFDALVSGRDVLLSWTTMSETDNAGFEVEQRSGGETFNTIGFVAGAGSSSQALRYSHTVADLQTGEYGFRLKQLDLDGGISYSQVVEVAVGPPTSFRLLGSYPNPFNPSSAIEFALPLPAHVTVTVYDVVGRLVSTLVDGPMAAGYHTVAFDGAEHASGIYLYIMQAGSFHDVKTMLLLK